MEPAPAPANSPDVTYAATRDGRALPVIDVTHPSFAVVDGPEAVAALRNAHVEAERRRRMPRFAMRLMLRVAARRSPLVRALVKPDAAFLNGLATYVLKLGATNLVAPFDGDIDRRIAASPLVTSIRLRLQQVARLLARGLEPALIEAPGTPLHLINVGGGPAIDSINALIVLKRSHPGLLARPVTIHVLDVDEAGPAFGANALAALRGEGGPLAGVDASLRHEPYNWSDPQPLERLTRRLTDEHAIVAASSEGALFEYAEDAAVVANLKALRVGQSAMKLVAGSVTRADALTRRMVANSRFKLMPRGTDGIALLAAYAGFVVAQAESSVVSDQVVLHIA